MIEFSLTEKDKMKIIGIEPKSPGLHIFSQSYVPRLGLPQLLTIAKNLGHNCEIFCEEITPIPWPEIASADLILISSTTSTTPRAYAIIKKIREDFNCNAPILMGGPHVTFLPEEALLKGADYVFRHEADESFVSFISWWQQGRRPDKLLEIPGLSFKEGDQYRHTTDPPLVDLDSIPTPDLSLIKGYKPAAIPLITSRGCPWSCDFCSEIAMFGRTYRFRSTEKVIDDIKYYDSKYGKTPIFIADDNLAANRTRLEQLCVDILKNRLIRSYSAQVRLDIAKDRRILKLLNLAGFERFYIGYESTNPGSLESAHKGLSSVDMANYTRIIHKFGFAIHAMWVIGFDSDTTQTVKENVRAAVKWHIETNQFLILVPIPGAELFRKFNDEKRIFSYDWAQYDGHHVTFYPAQITPRQLQVAVMLDAMPKLYGYWRTARIFAIDNWTNVTASFRPRTWHPIRRFKASLLTLAARIWGRHATHKMKKPIRSYLNSIPHTAERAR
jgi:anaerobic magnesium-protoporphyrin IX monomethyl ester cyclase